MKERAAYQAASGGQQSVESSGTAAVPPFVEADKPRAKARAAAAVPGLTFPRFFTEAGVDPFDEVEWETRSALIGNERGEVLVHVKPQAGQQRGVVVVEGIWPNKHFDNGIGINAITSSQPGWPNGGAVFHDTAVWIKAA